MSAAVRGSTATIFLSQEIPMPGRLFDKVAIVTGAGTGIGEAIALKFAQEGARLLLVGLPDDPVEDVARTINGAGGFAEIYLGDIAEERHAQAAIEACVSAYGRIDVLVNNAGVFLAVAETQDYPIDKFDETFRSNVRSVFLMTKFALPICRRRTATSSPRDRRPACSVTRKIPPMAARKPSFIPSSAVWRRNRFPMACGPIACARVPSIRLGRTNPRDRWTPSSRP
jgi:NAD(P)-dependent dehydrogenase (short-subunit alcohol dehydrogenase family)